MELSSSGRHPPIDQRPRLRIIRLCVVLGIAGLLVTRPAWNEASAVHELIELIGFGLVLLCIIGRLWSILYIGGRKNVELVVSGPYSITRNPLYLFSTIGAAGVGLMFGSLVAASLFGVTTYILLFKTARREECFLRGRFGPAYQSYEKRTPLFWPNPILYLGARQEVISPKAVRRTFREACLLLLFFPLIETSEYLQTEGLLPAVLCVY
ncbi:methyltransferase family protein [Sinorhizobium alkalisoli]|uniref:Isoprenylcysteine carboxyl methyltransferase n=1 Tax=Sinorhizobium alkalisoli TaxID=1752398 RepID=A0A1E3VI00_9HYPH|nr:isoprenylcysteine carboxylmethyltransferase family protein [Sinorhizobium alkalisoli]MCG5480236.1 isoprenylcysteine carboxylmethyltransferase family protein [Sinorhizobium alkalisoli]ODR93212.1 isoprenylcysteine carboxyl methyltransferase [Sinorhizobium alkalisoli]